MIKPWTSRTSKCPKEPPKLTALYFKILFVLDQAPINKVVALALIYKFAFGQNLSSAQNSSE